MKKIKIFLDLLGKKSMILLYADKILSKMNWQWKWGNKIYLYILIFIITVIALISFFPSNSKFKNDIDVSIFGPALPRHFFESDEKINPPLIGLGRKLYYDKRLSKDNELSCNSCHQLNNYGVDGIRFSLGYQGQRTERNAPSVYMAAPQIAQCWDGRFPTVEEQAKAAILRPLEMAMSSEQKVVEVINAIPEYVAAFKKAFPTEANPVTLDNVGNAIGAFERGLVTMSPFDAYFAGDKKALDEQQKRGMRLFVDVGCATCHNGTYLGGQMYRKTGLYRPWPNQEDQGRYEITKKEADRLTFKVSSLRNVAKTAPYYHDGLIKTLDDAVRHMAINQLGKQLSEGDIKDIVAFLDSLTGDLPINYIQEPTLFRSQKNLGSQ